MSRIVTVKTEVLKFNELTEEGKEKAIEKLYNINVDHDWWDCEYDDFKQVAACIGIEIDEIWFSGFSCQGDGACFEGTYEYQKGGLKAIKDYAPIDATLHQIAKDLQEIQRKAFYGLTATIKHSGHYYHEYCTDITVYQRDSQGYKDDCAGIAIHESIEEELRRFMRWMYKQLNKQYDYLTSKEAIVETIAANDYEFTADGEIY